MKKSGGFLNAVGNGMNQPDMIPQAREYRTPIDSGSCS